MANPTDVLLQLQTQFNMIDKLKNIKVNSEDIGSSSSTGAAGFGTSLANRYDSDGTDVEDVQGVDEPYITNRATTPADNDKDIKVELEQIFNEVEVPPEEAEVPPEAPVEAPAEGEVPPEAPAEGEVPPEGVEGEVPPGEDMNAMGGAAEPEIKSPSEIGRVYELKKIYTRLTTIESYISDTSDPELLRVRVLVSKAIELFEILSSNIPTYQPPKAPKERIDEIIVMYYKFLKQVYESVATYYKTKSNKMKNIGLTKINTNLSNKESI